MNAATTDGFASQLERRIRSGELKLPVLPEIARKVLDLTRSEAADAKALADVLHQDQALASQVLRMANSPRYAPKVPIVSLTQALGRLGFRTVGQIALAVVVGGPLFEVPGQERHLRSVWCHALATAGFAREIARHRRHNTEQAYLAGLLHSIGVPATVRALFDLQDGLDQTVPASVLAWLVERNQRMVGVRLATGWNLPAAVGETIQHFKAPREAPTCAETAATVRLAARFADGERELDGDPQAAFLNLYPHDLEAIAAGADAIQQQVQALAA